MSYANPALAAISERYRATGARVEQNLRWIQQNAPNMGSDERASAVRQLNADMLRLEVYVRQAADLCNLTPHTKECQEIQSGTALRQYRAQMDKIRFGMAQKLDQAVPEWRQYLKYPTETGSSKGWLWAGAGLAALWLLSR